MNRELLLCTLLNDRMSFFPLAFPWSCPQLFSHILKREFHDSSTKHLSRKFTEWVYGPVTCCLYDLAALDSYQDNSVLEILVYDSGIPVSIIAVRTVSAAAAWSPDSNGCFLSETTRDAPDGANEPAARVQVEELCRSNVSIQLPGLHDVLVHLHCHSV